MSDEHTTLHTRSLSRRLFLAGAAGTAAVSLLAACGGNNATNPTATSVATSVAPTTVKSPTTGTGAAGGGATATKPAGGVGASPSPSKGVASPTVGVSPTTQASPSGNAKPGGAIIIGTLGEAKTINPFVSAESEGDWRVWMLFGSLVKLDPQTFEPKPDLAKAWEVNNLTFTFTLQDNLKFSDGSTLTADDVAFTLKGILAKATGSPRASYVAAIDGATAYSDGTAQDVAGIKVVDPKTIALTLAKPDAAFLINMRYLSPVPMKMLNGKDLSSASQDPFFQNPVGAGPFQYVSWKVGGDFVAERNPNYYQPGKPYLDKFTHRVIADSQSLVNALLAGDIDGSLYPSPSGADKLKANKDLTVAVPPFSSPDGWQFSFTANPYLAKKEVRQAVAYALDMEQFAKDSLYGLGQPGLGPIAPGNWAFNANLTPYKLDMNKAKQLLDQAGPPPDGIEFMVNKGNVLREDFLTYTQQQLQQLGWNITPLAIEWATLTDRVTKKDFMVLGSVFSGATVDPGELADQFTTGGSQNYSNYSNPQLDALMAQGKTELDRTKATEIWKQVQVILQEELPTYFAWYRPFLHVIKAQFKGWVDSIDTGGIFKELQDVYVSQ